MADKDDDKNEETPVADHTPETPAAPPAADPAPQPAHDDSLKAVVAKLEETVSGLVERVEQLTPMPTQEPDHAPVSRPWTHKDFR